MQVRAICTHISPDQQYRIEGEKFPYTGKLYKHIEKAKSQDPEPEPGETDAGGSEG